MVEKALDDGTAKNRLNLDSQTLAAVVLQGIEGILHAKPLDTVREEETSQMKEKATEYVRLVLGIDS